MISQRLIKQLKRGVRNADENDFHEFKKFFLQNKRIFITGSGRSGLVGNFFAMRLMHLGNRVFVLGETNTPSIQKGDILVTISASGTTSSVVNAATTAKKHEATVLAITANPKGLLQELADFTVMINTRDKKKRKKSNMNDRKTPLGTLFELSSLLYLETLISEIMYVCNIDEEIMRARHVNI